MLSTNCKAGSIYVEETPAALGVKLSEIVTGHAAELVLRLSESLVMATPGLCVEGKPAKVNVGTCGALAGATAIVCVCVAVCAGFPESETFTLNEKVPGVVGVPVIEPVDALRVKPPGNGVVEDIEKVYGIVPPAAAQPPLGYATPTCAPAGKEQLRVKVAGLIATLNACVAVCPELSVTLTVNE